MLTREQRIKDYEYLWRVLNSCFPVREVMKHVGLDWKEIEEKCRPGVENAADDLEFCKAVNRVFEEFGHFSHSNLLNARMFENYKKMMNSFVNGEMEIGADPEGLRPWADIFNHEKSEQFYSRFDSTEGAGRDFYRKGEAPEKPVTAAHEQAKAEEGPFAYGAMLPGRVAYFRIPSLSAERIPIDRPVFFDFYEKYRSCSDMILDFRGNGGGATSYWSKLIVEPIIPEPLTVVSYMLYCDSEYNRDFVKYGFSEEVGEFRGEKHPIEDLKKEPGLPKLSDDYLIQPTNYYKAFEEYKPDPEHRFTVENGIWMLTDKRVYSSSEGFAYFCRSTGFAKLVGETTGGDGVGITPFHAMLPESGLIIRYSGEMGLNPDGSSNPECRTVPDIECDPALALAVCLAAIAARES